MKRIFTYVALGLLVAVLLLAACSPKPKEIIVASKRDTEGAVLAQMIILKLRAELNPDDYKVIDKTWMGSTEELREALVNGDIDIYPEYTGNSAFFFDDIESDVWKREDGGWTRLDPKDYGVDPKNYDSDNIAFAMNKILLPDNATTSDKATTIRTNDVVWLERAPANNSWAIVVSENVAEDLNLGDIGDLDEYPDGRVLFYGSKEFFSGPMRSFEKKYRLSLAWDQKRIVSNPTYAEHLVANRGEKKETGDNYTTVYAAMAYTTDGYLGKVLLVKDLRILKDSKEALPVYAPAPVIRLEVYEEIEEICKKDNEEDCFEKWLNPIFRGLTTEVLQYLNGEMDFLGGKGYEVAREHLVSANITKIGMLTDNQTPDSSDASADGTEIAMPTDYPTPDFFKPSGNETEIEIVNNKITVEPQTFWQSEFYVDTDFMKNVKVKGWAKASGGAFNDIKILILNDVDFTNWENFHNVEVKNVVYKSDKITKAEIIGNITEPGSYHLVVCNRFSEFSSKDVRLKVHLYYEKRKPTE